jgi:hypothetical protein
VTTGSYPTDTEGAISLGTKRLVCGDDRSLASATVVKKTAIAVFRKPSWNAKG